MSGSGQQGSPPAPPCVLNRQKNKWFIFFLRWGIGDWANIDQHDIEIIIGEKDMKDPKIRALVERRDELQFEFQGDMALPKNVSTFLTLWARAVLSLVF